MRSFSSTTSLKASATLPATPVHSIGNRTPDLPRLSDVRAESSVTIAACDGSVARQPGSRICSLPSLAWGSWTRHGNSSQAMSRNQFGGLGLVGIRRVRGNRPRICGKRNGQRSNSRWIVPQRNWLHTMFQEGCGDLPVRAQTMEMSCPERLITNSKFRPNLPRGNLQTTEPPSRTKQGRRCQHHSVDVGHQQRDRDGCPPAIPPSGRPIDPREAGGLTAAPSATDFRSPAHRCNERLTATRSRSRNRRDSQSAVRIVVRWEIIKLRAVSTGSTFVKVRSAVRVRVQLRIAHKRKVAAVLIVKTFPTAKGAGVR